MSDPQKFAVLLKDHNGNLLQEIHNLIDSGSLTWDWNRIGGCGMCSMRVKTEWDSALASSFSEDAQIEIFAPDKDGVVALRYFGELDKVTPKVSGNDEFLTVNWLGLVNRLKKVNVPNRAFISKELSVVAKDVIDTFAVPITPMTTTAADFEDTNFSADRVDFNESAFEVITKLANIAGKTEWGVRPDKSVYFLRRNDSRKHTFHITEDFTSFRFVRDFGPIITGLLLQGKDGFESSFKVTNRVSLKEKILSDSSISTQTVAQQFGRATLKEIGRERRSYTGALRGKNRHIESSLPIGRAAINVRLGVNLKYDVATQFYDSGLKYDGGTQEFEISKIKYRYIDDDTIDTTLIFGPTPIDMVDDLVKLQSDIVTERNK